MANTLVTQTIVEQGAYHRHILLEYSIDTVGELPALVHGLGFTPTKIIVNTCSLDNTGLAVTARIFPQVTQAGGTGTAMAWDADGTNVFLYTNGPAVGTTEAAYCAIWVGLEHSISD